MDVDFLQFDLYCTNINLEPQYRIYIDEDFLVERNYIWNNAECFVRENCELRLDTGLHKISIIADNPEIFVIKNALFNSEPLEVNTDGSFTKP